MEAKGSTFLKVTGILMIVFGAIALIVSIIAILGIAALAAFNISIPLSTTLMKEILLRIDCISSVG